MMKKRTTRRSRRSVAGAFVNDVGLKGVAATGVAAPLQGVAATGVAAPLQGVAATGVAAPLQGVAATGVAAPLQGVAATAGTAPQIVAAPALGEAAIGEGSAPPIFVDASRPATLLNGSASTDCPTLQEAVIAWYKLSANEREHTTIQVTDGPLYTAQEIARLHYAPSSDARERWEGKALFPRPTLEPDPSRWEGSALFARPTLQPDPSHWAQDSNFDDAAIAASRRRLNAAVQSTMTDNAFVPPPTPPGPVSVAPSDTPSAGTAPVATASPPRGTVSLEARGTAMASGRAAPSVNPTAPVELRAAPLETGKVAPRISFRDNVEKAEALTRALSSGIKERIGLLKNERRNAPEAEAEISFLEGVCAALDQIAAAISDARRAETPEDRERKFAEADTLANRLASACRNFAERNYERIVDYGGFSLLTILGTLFLTGLFDMRPDEALAAQLALLGLSGTKK